MAGQADKLVMRLIDVVREERRLLTHGRLEDLSKIERKKNDLLQRLQRTGTPGPTAALRKLRSLSAENQRLYLAAIDGARRVRDQVASLIAGHSEFQTYGANGGRKKMAGETPTVQKRA